MKDQPNRPQDVFERLPTSMQRIIDSLIAGGAFRDRDEFLRCAVMYMLYPFILYQNQLLNESTAQRKKRSDRELKKPSRGKLGKFIMSLLDIIEEYSIRPNTGMPYEDLCNLVRTLGVLETECQEVIENLKNSGKIYEPQPGFLALVHSIGRENTIKVSQKQEILEAIKEALNVADSRFRRKSRLTLKDFLSNISIVVNKLSSGKTLHAYEINRTIGNPYVAEALLTAFKKKEIIEEVKDGMTLAYQWNSEKYDPANSNLVWDDLKDLIGELKLRHIKN
jgi:Arc/MetJ-type ribon-helix-helix transcriptional regulator